MTFRTIKLFALLLVSVWLSACATLDPDYEQPTVDITSFKTIPAEGMMPAFEIGLRIINPNSTPLNLEGVVYSISLQGNELIKGVGKDYEPIDSYSEGTVTLVASASVLKGIRFISDLTKNQGDEIDYEFEAKLDVGGFYPSIKVSETGVFNLNERSDTNVPD